MGGPSQDTAADAVREKLMLHNAVRLPHSIYTALGCSAGAYFMLMGAELHEPILKMERWLTARAADVDHATLWDTASDVLGLYGSKDNRDLLRELPGTFHAFEVIVLQQPGRLF